MSLLNKYSWYSGVLILYLLCIDSNIGFAQGVLQIGDKAPLIAQGVEDVSGRTLSLEGVKETNGLLVVFSCNTCPFVAKWEDSYNEIAQVADNNNIGMIALNPNERIRNRGESLAEMKMRAQKKDYIFSYAVDKNHTIADAFGAKQTPEVFLFNAEMILVYHGAVDSGTNSSGKSGTNYTLEAIQALMSGSSIKNQLTKSPGCSIKRTE